MLQLGELVRTAKMPDFCIQVNKSGPDSKETSLSESQTWNRHRLCCLHVIVMLRRGRVRCNVSFSCGGLDLRACPDVMVILVAY